MANDVQILDGFRYEIEEGTLWNSAQGVETKVVVAKFIDDERGVEFHAYFKESDWEKYKADVNGGLFVPNREAIEKLGL